MVWRLSLRNSPSAPLVSMVSVYGETCEQDRCSASQSADHGLRRADGRLFRVQWPDPVVRAIARVAARLLPRAPVLGGIGGCTRRQQRRNQYQRPDAHPVRVHRAAGGGRGPAHLLSATPQRLCSGGTSTHPDHGRSDGNGRCRAAGHARITPEDTRRLEEMRTLSSFMHTVLSDALDRFGDGGQDHPGEVE